MTVINNINDKEFSFNDIHYYKNFTPVVTPNSDKVRILNTYDSSIELTTAPTLFSDFVVDGVTYTNVSDLQEALLPVVYTRNSLGNSNTNITPVATLPTVDIDLNLIYKLPDDSLQFYNGTDWVVIGGGGSQGLQEVLDVNGYAEWDDGNSYVNINENTFTTSHSDGVNKSNLILNKYGYYNLLVLITDTIKKTYNSSYEGLTFYFKTLADAWIRNIAIKGTVNGLKISSRSDDTEIGVVLTTDNLTVDRTRAEQDKDGTYALMSDFDNLTLEQARLNGNLIEGDIEFVGGINTNGFKQINPDEYVINSLDFKIEEGIINKCTVYDNLIDLNIQKEISSVQSSSTSFLSYKDYINDYYSEIKVDETGVEVKSTKSNSRGLYSLFDFSPNYDDNTYVQKKWVDDNFASKSATAKTGTALTFTSPDIYGTFTTPETGNIIVDLTDAKLGIVQKMYHQNGTIPTFPAGFVKKGSIDYSIIGKNEIYFEFSEGTRVEYWIVNI